MSIDGERMVAYFLEHAEYDPVKAREYYLRNRQLKGRTSTAIIPPVGLGRKKVVAVKPKQIVKPVIKLTSQQRRTAQLVKIKSMEVKLAKLRKLLAVLVAQAKRRNGVGPANSTSESTPGSSAGNKRTSRLTPREKAEKSKDAKEAYQKERKLPPDQKVEALSEKIKDIEEKLADIRASIASENTVKK